MLLLHGWPSCFLEYVAAIPLLTAPASHGMDGPSFDVVVPSLPGYGFSQRPTSVGVNYAAVAGLFLQLMERLGYERFGAGGGDFGSGVAAHMGLQAPDRLLGLHLTNVEIGPEHEGNLPWTDEESAFFQQRDQWAARQRGYAWIQSTKPQTIGYGLTDSPAGLAGWLIEKWRSWTDSQGDPAVRLSRDFLATLLTIYWATRSITSSMLDYYDNRWRGAELAPDAYVEVPTAIALFGHQYVKEAEPPRSWVERLYNVHRWTVMPAGGHFAPAEEPDLFAQDLAAAFGGSRSDRH
jgi:pimeloyl-ACP methyl ester carboxylesterase